MTTKKSPDQLRSQWATLETRKTKHEIERTAAESLAVWTAHSEAQEVQILADVRAAVEEFNGRRTAGPITLSQPSSFDWRPADCDVPSEDAVEGPLHAVNQYLARPKAQLDA